MVVERCLLQAALSDALADSIRTLWLNLNRARLSICVRLMSDAQFNRSRNSFALEASCIHNN